MSLFGGLPAPKAADADTRAPSGSGALFGDLPPPSSSSKKCSKKPDGLFGGLRGEPGGGGGGGGGGAGGGLFGGLPPSSAGSGGLFGSLPPTTNTGGAPKRSLIEDGAGAGAGASSAEVRRHTGVTCCETGMCCRMLTRADTMRVHGRSCGVRVFTPGSVSAASLSLPCSRRPVPANAARWNRRCVGFFCKGSQRHGVVSGMKCRTPTSCSTTG